MVCLKPGSQQHSNNKSTRTVLTGNKKVLLHERKRHTARRIASVRPAVLSRGLPHPDLAVRYPSPVPASGVLHPNLAEGRVPQSWPERYPQSWLEGAPILLPTSEGHKVHVYVPKLKVHEKVLIEVDIFPPARTGQGYPQARTGLGYTSQPDWDGVPPPPERTWDQ